MFKLTGAAQTFHPVPTLVNVKVVPGVTPRTVADVTKMLDAYVTDATFTAALAALATQNVAPAAGAAKMHVVQVKEIGWPTSSGLAVVVERSANPGVIVKSPPVVGCRFVEQPPPKKANVGENVKDAPAVKDD